MNNENLIDKIVYLMETDDSADAPADSVKWAKNIFRSRVAEPRRSIVQKIIAVLQLDLAPDKAAFGERSASASAVRQMLFSAGDNSIDLRIAAAKTRSAITAQVLGAGFENASVTFEGVNRSYTTTTNELSEFKLDAVANGTYRMTLTGETREVIIEEIKVG